MRSAVELVQRFRCLRALVIGDAMLDTYIEGTAARLCSEGPVPVVQKGAEHHLPGGAANTAANLSALGATVAFLGVVGDDLAGSLLRRALRAHGADDGALVEEDGRATLHKLRIIADGQYVVRLDDGDTGPARPPTVARMLAHLERAFAESDVVVVSDYRYGAIAPAIVDRLAALQAERPRALLIDSKDLLRFRAVPATVATPNHLEAQLLAGDAGGGKALALEQGVPLAALEQIGRRLLDRLAVRHAAITLGAAGVLLVERDGPMQHLPTHPVPNGHDVGAGDSFAAAMALALAAGAGVAEAAQIGMDAAGIAVTKRLTAPAPLGELLQRVSLREHAAAAALGLADAKAPEALAQLLRRLDDARRAGRTIVFTNGVFDVLHAGHVRFLRQARALGDLLVVGVNSDRSARALRGGRRLINGERDRLALVTALEAVDYVIAFDEETPEALVRLLRPHIHVKGGDYAAVPLPESEAVREAGGRVEILPLVGAL